MTTPQPRRRYYLISWRPTCRPDSALRTCAPVRANSRRAAVEKKRGSYVWRVNGDRVITDNGQAYTVRLAYMTEAEAAAHPYAHQP